MILQTLITVHMPSNTLTVKRLLSHAQVASALCGKANGGVPVGQNITVLPISTFHSPVEWAVG